MEDVFTFTESQLLWCISANSNGFIQIFWDTEEVRVGKRIYSFDEFLEQWEQNGENVFNGKPIKRFR
jgi:hypothetical protein